MTDRLPDQALTGRRIAVPETRQLDVLAAMLERHGAEVLRCPLVSIRDTPETEAVLAWLRRFIANPPDDLILFTGEGLQRLLGFARRAGIEADFVAALGRVRRITRGPKPARVLRELALKPDIAVEPPTTDGIIAALSGQEMAGRRVAVQLYPDNPSQALFQALGHAAAQVDPVLPYVYGDEADDRRVVETIREMAAGTVDLITFTSSPQVRRLQHVAAAHDCETELREGLERTVIAAVGPVVGAAIEAAGGRVAIAPAENFHMRPMVNEILAALDAGIRAPV